MALLFFLLYAAIAIGASTAYFREKYWRRRESSALTTPNLARRMLWALWALVAWWAIALFRVGYLIAGPRV